MALQLDPRAKPRDAHTYAKRWLEYNRNKSTEAESVVTSSCTNAEQLDRWTTIGEVRFRYTIDDGGNARLVGSAPADKTKGYPSSLALPETIEGLIVSSIAPAAFLGIEGVTEVICPNSITYIGKRAFERCKDLRRIVFSHNLSYFDHFWVRDCNVLDEVILPDKITSFGPGLFQNNRIKRLYIGRETKDVDPAAFPRADLELISVHKENPYLMTDGTALYSHDGKKLIALALRVSTYSVLDGCEVIGRKSCADNIWLTHIDFPDTVKEIEPFGIAHTQISSFIASKNLETIGEKSFFRCEKLTQVVLNRGLRSIGSEAFSLTALQSLTIPASVSELGKKITAKTNISFSDEGCSVSVDPDNELYILDSSGGLYQRCDRGLIFVEFVNPEATELHIQDTTIEIADRAVSHHQHLEEVFLPEGLIRIGYWAFRACRNLRHVVFPESLEALGSEVFYDTALENLYLGPHFNRMDPNALITRGSNRNLEPPSLHEVSIHPRCERFFLESGLLCERTKTGCEVLLYVGPDSDVFVPEGTRSIMPYAFAGAVGIHELHLPSSLRVVDLNGLAVGGPVSLLTLDLSKPVEGRSHVEIPFPNDSVGKGAFIRAFKSGRPDPAGILSHYDGCLSILHDMFDKACRMLDRLEDPYLLDEKRKERFITFLSRHVKEICLLFSDYTYNIGFDRMINNGFLNEENITSVIDAMNHRGDVEMTGYLLQLKRTKLGISDLDFEL